MTRPTPSWSLVCWLLLACLPLPSLAQQAPAKPLPRLKAVPVTEQEAGTVRLMELMTDACPVGTVNEAQSFRIDQPGASQHNALFITMQCNDHPFTVGFGFYRVGELQRKLPSHPANQWTVDEVKAVSFPDLNGDGRFEVLAIVSAMSGMGPEGAYPFAVAAVWFEQPDGTWASDPKADKALESLRNPDVKKAVAALKKVYAKKK
jgi:hypothetical protein